MKQSFTYERTVRVTTIDDYNYVIYKMGTSVEYNEEDMEKQSIIPSIEFENLREMIDEQQRKIIKKELGKVNLHIDVLRERFVEEPKMKMKLKLKKKL